jgi:hypothetical protein
MGTKVLGSGLKMEAIYSSETVVPTCKSARRYNPEDRHGDLPPWLAQIYCPDRGAVQTEVLFRQLFSDRAAVQTEVLCMTSRHWFHALLATPLPL